MILLHVDLFGFVIGVTEKIGDPSAMQATIHSIAMDNPTVSKVKIYLKTTSNGLVFHST